MHTHDDTTPDAYFKIELDGLKSFVTYFLLPNAFSGANPGVLGNTKIRIENSTSSVSKQVANNIYDAGFYHAT